MQGIELSTSLIKRFISLIYNDIYTTYRFCFPLVFKWTANKGGGRDLRVRNRRDDDCALLFQPQRLARPVLPLRRPVTVLLFGIQTAIYTIIPDCVEYGEWVTGVRNDGFQYAFISLGNKIGMALGISLLAQALEAAGYVSNAAQNETVLSIMRHAFSTIPGILWVATAAALFFYKLNKRTYNRIVEVIRHRAAKKRGLRSIAK